MAEYDALPGRANDGTDCEHGDWHSFQRFCDKLEQRIKAIDTEYQQTSRQAPGAQA